MKTLPFTGDPAADEFLAENHFALLVGMLLDQQVPFEWAFSAPKKLEQRMGGQLDAASVAKTDEKHLVELFSDKPALHRFPASMARRVHALAQAVVDDFGGDTDAIWKSASSGEELFDNLSKLPGFGKQKSKIFVALLGKRLGIQPPGWRESSAPYGEPDAMLSIADVDGKEALGAVRAHKRQLKAAAKSLATLEASKPKTVRRKA
jgi:uncharacterized HhH-GPD family protein